MNIAYIFCKECNMWDRKILKEVIGILMESKSYFRLSVKERLCIIKHLMTVLH